MPAVERDDIARVTLMKRRPSLTRDHFSRYCRIVHGPLVTSFQKALGFAYHEQWHTRSDAATLDAASRSRRARGMVLDRDFDAVSVMWYSRSAWESALTAEGKEAYERVARDEENFLDAGKSFSFAVQVRYEAGSHQNLHPRDLPSSLQSGMVVFPLVRPPGVSRENFQRRWREVHGPLVEAVMADFGGCKYMQMHTISDSLATRYASDMVVDGLALVWSVAAANRVAGRRANIMCLQDEKLFIDLPKSFLMISEPRWRSTDYPVERFDQPGLSTQEYEELKATVADVADTRRAIASAKL